MALPRESFCITNTKPWVITEVAGHLTELIDTETTLPVLTQMIGNLSGHKA